MFMMEGFADNSIEQVRGSLVAIIGEQNFRLIEITKRQDGVLSVMSDEPGELRRMVRDLQGGGPSHLRESGSHAS